jgi:membrane protein YqaA with SNARE-associated domain
MMLENAGLGGMFLAGFLAATPLPMQSELVLLALAGAGWGLEALVIVASLGNVLGSCVTYAAGRGIEGAGLLSRLSLPPEKLDRAQNWFRRWGAWSLLLSWAPGGDVLVALAGMARMPLARFLPVIALVKTARYILFAWLTSAAL